MTTWVDRALLPARRIQFEQYEPFLSRGSTLGRSSSHIADVGRAVRLLRDYGVDLPGHVSWALQVLKSRGNLQRNTEKVLYRHRETELRARFPRIHALIMESWRRGGLQYHGQFAQLLETAELYERSGARSCLELGSGVSSAMLASLIGDAKHFTTVEESPHWHTMLQTYLAPFPGAVTSVRADRVVITRDGEPVVHYDIDHTKPFDFVYVDGPSNKVDDLPPELARKARDLDPDGRLANIDVELMWEARAFPKMIVIDGRRSTVARLMRKSGGRYDVYLKSSYVNRAMGRMPEYELHHTVMTLRG